MTQQNGNDDRDALEPAQAPHGLRHRRHDVGDEQHHDVVGLDALDGLMSPADYRAHVKARAGK